MIEAVRIRGFKRFGDIEFRLPGPVVLAGPNDSGKTTALQAIAAWAFALRTWRNLNDFNPRRGFVRAPIGRLEFAPVPLRSFEHLWTDRKPWNLIEIHVRHRDGWTVVMELHPDTSEQVFVRPRRDADGGLLRRLDLPVVLIPPMTGVETNERHLQPMAVEQILGTANPGLVLRNLIVAAYGDDASWAALQNAIGRLFGYRLLPPNTSGPFIVAEYEPIHSGPKLDISSGGSGFRQVVMLLSLLFARRNAVLLLDEPDVHLHVILQDAIWRELRVAAIRSRSQMIAATHSETVINAVDPRELCILLNTPRIAANTAERDRLNAALRVVSNVDLMRAMDTPGVLYVEDYTDRNILRAWARVLKHPAERLLDTELLWKPIVFQHQEGRPGVRAKDHYDALLLARPDLPGLELLDGDAHADIPETAVSGTGLQRLRWRRYEIESYLLHPDALARFVEKATGDVAAGPAVRSLRSRWHQALPPDFAQNPHHDDPLVMAVKARTRLLPPLLASAGIHDLPYTRYHEIAALMRPEEIHSEVSEKLDAICEAFRVTR